MKKKSLILTGWSKVEYFAAAAAALEALKGDADVAGVSMDRLAEALSERAPKYAEVYVLGVGLKKNIGGILAALRELKAKQVKSVWLSSIPVAPEFAAEVCIEGEDPSLRGFDVLEDTVRGTLVDAVLDYFGNLDADSASFYRAYALEAEDRSSAVGKYQMMARAAGFMHRTRGDDAVYERAIRSLYERVRPLLWDERLKDAYEDYVRFGRRELVGKSPVLEDMRKRILLAAKYERARVLILGASGTGKETVAQQIHMNSPRKKGRFVAFNCASVAKDLLEDRFFGHEKGAFTGADKQSAGLFERADHGTLFLDEIGEMPLEAQALLLRAIQDKKILRVGGTVDIPVDVRLVCATNCNLPKMVREKKFREDLYQRISTIVITTPALKDHKEDIPGIAENWWRDMDGVRLSKDQLDVLMSYDYPGNVRELLNILDRARALEITDFRALLAEHIEINKDLWDDVSEGGPTYPDDLDLALRQHVKSVFDKYNRNMTAARNALGISLNTLKKYLVK